MKSPTRSARYLTILLSLIITAIGPASADETTRPDPPPTIEITTPDLPSGYQGDEYSTVVRIAEGRAKVAFIAVGLPEGLSISPSGALSGKLKDRPGDYRVRLIAVDPDQPEHFDETVLTLTVHEPLAVLDKTLTPAVAGAPYRQAIPLRGGSDARRARLTGLPPGLTMDPAGLITGIPEAGPARHTLVLTIEDPDFPAHRLVQTLPLTVYGPLTVTSGSPPPIRVGAPLTWRIEARGGSGRYLFSALDLPPGLTLDPESGRLAGILQGGRGDYHGRVEVRDQRVTATAVEDLVLTLVDFFPDDQEGLETDIGGNRLVPGPSIREHTFHHPGDRDEMILDLSDLAPLDVVRIRTLPRTKATRPVLDLMDPSGRRVPGLDRIDTGGYADGVFVCDTPGLYRLTITEASGDTGDYGLDIARLGPRVRLSTPTLPDQQTPGPVYLTITAEAGSGFFVFEAEDLPPGLAMTEDGRIEGNLTAPPGDYPITIRVRDPLWGDLGEAKPYTLTLVDFFPDAYEANEVPAPRETATVITADGRAREHTFHEPGDRDALRLDTAGVTPGHVLRIRTLPRSRPTPTRLTVIDADGRIILTDQDRSPAGMSDLFLEISDHKTRFLIIDHPDSQTGDYGLIVDDMGPRIRIATDHLPDALSRGAYAVDITAADGSGSFAFSSDPLPQGLALDPSGRLRGELTIAPGVYPLTITVKDLIHEGITDTRRFDLSVVRFFPDAFEALNDDGPGTENTMTPGTAPQTHCFHDDKDLDWVRLDLHAIEPGDRIIVKTSGLSEPVQTGLRLLDDQNRVMATAGGTPETTLVFDCARPAVYRLEIRETQSRIGDYKLIVSNSGQPLTLSTATLTHAESDRPHRQTLDVLGGCGRYRFVIDEGALPPGLTLDEHTGLITGRNTHWGTFTLTIRIDDRLFAENHTRRTYTMDAFMGRKLSGKTRFVFPHYQTGTFSMTALTTTTRAFPGTLHGGTPGNLRYRIIDHTVPLDRFTLAFDTRTGELTLTEPGPVSCNRYTPDDLDVAVEVSDRVYTNNRFVFHYDIPARCLSY